MGDKGFVKHLLERNITPALERSQIRNGVTVYYRLWRLNSLIKYFPELVKHR
jgi:hypothetical protein